MIEKCKRNGKELSFCFKTISFILFQNPKIIIPSFAIIFSIMKEVHSVASNAFFHLNSLLPVNT